jgi:hypothetical protein
MTTPYPSDAEWGRIMDRVSRAENDTAEAASVLDGHPETSLISDEIKRIEAELGIVLNRLSKVRTASARPCLTKQH